jgi:tetratricopeptide (TPR) repeat protein
MKPGCEDIRDAEFLGRHYSRALNYWGVQLQRENHLQEAHTWFESAQRLNKGNVAAVVNAKFNESLRGGKVETVRIEKSVREQLDAYPNWASFVQACGPVDDPGFCQRLAEVFGQGTLYRQAAQQLIRAASLKPEDLTIRFQLANVFLQGRRPDKTLEILNELKERQEKQPLSLVDRLELIRLEAWAQYNPTNLQVSERLLLEARQNYPQSESILLNLSEMYLRAERYQDALDILDQQLALTPDNFTALLNKSAIYIKIEAYDKAIPVLNRILEIDPKNSSALMNRGIAYFRVGNLEKAEKDYKDLERQIPHYSWAYYRLAEIASQRKNIAEEIANYKLFLKYAPAEAIEVSTVRNRLKQLKAGP